MQLSKRSYLLVTFLTIFSLSSVSVFAADEDDFFTEDMWDSFDIDAAPSITRSADDHDALTVFTSTVALNDIVKDNIYLRTNAINDRPIESLPIFAMYHSDVLNEDSIFNCTTFFNQTSEQFFTHNNSNIGSYIKLSTQDFVEKIDENVAQIEFPPILELFRTGKVQERRLGFMFQYLKNIDKWSIEAIMPLMYQERNYFVSDSDISLIQQQVSKITGSTSYEVNEEYFRRHAVSDQIGVGNLKLKCGYRFMPRRSVKLKFGPVVVLPVSFAFKKGILGSDFRKKLEIPDLNLTKIYDLIVKITTGDTSVSEEFKDFGTDFLEKAARRLGAVLLDQSLGNRHHFELGLFADTKIVINENVSCLALGEFTYAVPKTELRFFNQLKDAADFTVAAVTENGDATYSGADPVKKAAAEALAEEKIKFLNKNAISSMFPNASYAKISPKFKAQFSIGPKFEVGAYVLHFGYNAWHAAEEGISNAKTFEEDLYPLDLDDDTAEASTQHKVFVNFNYSKVTPKHIWKLSIRGDETLTSKGIGKDFNVGIELSVDF